MNRSALARIPAWTFATAAMLLIQFSSALSMPIIDRVGPSGAAWLRMGFGALLLLLIVRPKLRAIALRDLPALLVLGTVTGFMTVFFLHAIERIPLGTAVAIEFLGPLTVAGIAGKRLKTLIWPLLAFAGVVVLTEPWHGEIDLVGVGFALLAGACWGLYNVFTQVVGDRFSGITGLSLTIPIAAIATAPVGLPQVIDGNLVWWVLPLAVGVALITPVVSFALEMIALRRMTHTAFGTLLAIEPAFGALIGLVVLSQAPSALQLVGIALVVIAGAMAQRGGTRASPSDAEPSFAAAPGTGPIPLPEAAAGPEPDRGPGPNDATGQDHAPGRRPDPASDADSGPAPDADPLPAPDADPEERP